MNVLIYVAPFLYKLSQLSLKEENHKQTYRDLFLMF